MLLLRIVTGVVVVPILLAMASDRGWLFLAGVALTGLLGTSEAMGMARHAGYRPLDPLAYLLTFSLLTAAAVASPAGIGQSLGFGAAPGFLGACLGLAVMTTFTVLLFRSNQRAGLADWSLTFGFPLYVAGLVQFYIPLRERADAGAVVVEGPLPIALTWPVMVMVTSWACDIAAYATGRAFGARRLAPSISPAKSVEGAVAGVVAAALAGTLFGLANELHLLRMAGFGLVVGVASIVGDLVESLLKRQCGVKDSGVIMPGHGGILDRMDALIFAAPAAYFYLVLVT